MEECFDLNTAPIARGLLRRPGPGQYVLSIHSVDVTNNAKGYKRMQLCFDIADGDHKYYYSERSKACKKNRYLKHYQLVNEPNSIDYFMLMIKCIEKSNLGYTFKWNESTLVGKKVGAILRIEEFRDLKTGVIVEPLKVFGFIPANEVDNTQPIIPAKRLKIESNNQMAFNSFNNDTYDPDDLPF